MKKTLLIIFLACIPLSLKAIEKTELICECISERTSSVTHLNFYRNDHKYIHYPEIYYDRGCLSEEIIFDSKKNSISDVNYASRIYIYSKITTTVIKAEAKFENQYEEMKSSITFDRYTGKMIEDYLWREKNIPTLGGYIARQKIFECKKRKRLF